MCIRDTRVKEMAAEAGMAIRPSVVKRATQKKAWFTVLVSKIKTKKKQVLAGGVHFFQLTFCIAA